MIACILCLFLDINPKKDKLTGEETEKYSQSYDPAKLVHPHIPTKLGKYMIDIDADLAPLMQRINQFQDEPLTTMSCQHSVQGWTRIDFSYDGFNRFIRMLRDQYLKKYGGIDHPLQGLYKRIINKRDCEVNIVMREYSNTSDVTLSIMWVFDPKEIPFVINEFDDLFLL